MKKTMALLGCLALLSGVTLSIPAHAADGGAGGTAGTSFGVGSTVGGGATSTGAPAANGQINGGSTPNGAYGAGNPTTGTNGSATINGYPNATAGSTVGSGTNSTITPSTPGSTSTYSSPQ